MLFVMDIDWFRDLATLAKTGNFSQAARVRNVSQPAFSRRIRALENWVGTGLVDRSTHPVKLTSIGSQMLEAGEQAIRRIETERETVRALIGQPDKYVVTFAAQHSISWRFYPAWLQAFEDAFGPLITRLRADDLPNCIDDLKKGDVDFVIAYQSEFSPSMAHFSSLEVVEIGTDKLVPVSKPAPEGKPLFDLDNLAAPTFPYLQFGAAAPIGHHIVPLIKLHGVSDKLVVVYENAMAGALRIRARDGAGVAWLPLSLVQPDLDNGLLTIAGSPKWWINLQVLVHRTTIRTNPVTRDIWAFLVAREGNPLISAASSTVLAK